MEMLRAHIALDVSIADEFLKSIKNAVEGNKGEVEKSLRIIEMTEKEADVLVRRIIDELTRGELPPKDRAELMRLARRTDWIADWIHESSRILSVLLPRIDEIWGPSEPLRNICIEIAERLQESTRLLSECIDKMMERDVEATLSLADKVERNEEEVDGLYKQARGHFIALDGEKVSTGIMIVFSQFLDGLENAADRCEYTCNQIRVITVGIIGQPKKRK